MKSTQRIWQTPTPEAGMRIVDPAFPDAPWVVAQYDNGDRYIYIRQEGSGRLWHHTAESWDYAWQKGYLRGI